jgi:hypothetical protein
LKIIHRAVTSSTFELVRTIELEIQLSDEDSWTTRIELFRDTEQSNLYRCRVWELELFRLTPSFPRNEQNEPAHVTDDTIMVERGIAHSEIASRLNKSFDAPSIEGALEMIVEDLKKFLEHATGEKAK